MECLTAISDVKFETYRGASTKQYTLVVIITLLLVHLFIKKLFRKIYCSLVEKQKLDDQIKKTAILGNGVSIYISTLLKRFIILINTFFVRAKVSENRYPLL